MPPPSTPRVLIVAPLATVMLSPAVMVTLPPWPDCVADALIFAFASTLTVLVAAILTEPPPLAPFARVFEADSSVIRSPSRMIRPPRPAPEPSALALAIGNDADSSTTNVPPCLITPPTS